MSWIRNWFGPLFPFPKPSNSGSDSETPTQPSMPAIKIATGSRCRRCKTFNEYAEPDRSDRTHVCTGCRHDGWHIWGDKK